MQRFDMKSIVLGIGIGIILTSIISIIYLAGVDPASKLSEAEIVKLAEKYGMVKNTSLINMETKEIKIIIESSDTIEVVAENLLNQGLLSDKKLFVSEMGKTKLTPGEYQIAKGTEIKDIIKLITAKK